LHSVTGIYAGAIKAPEIKKTSIYRSKETPKKLKLLK
jgi:hypothetical protein